jgi:hypothetical protein
VSDFQHTILERLNRAASEAAREALTAEFEARGLDFSDLHPMIRVVMERGAISTANAKQQVENFFRIAAMADRFNLTTQQKQYAIVKAYEQHGERLAEVQGVGRGGQGEAAASL